MQKIDTAELYPALADALSRKSSDYWVSLSNCKKNNTDTQNIDSIKDQMLIYMDKKWDDLSGSEKADLRVACSRILNAFHTMTIESAARISELVSGSYGSDGGLDDVIEGFEVTAPTAKRNRVSRALKVVSDAEFVSKTLEKISTDTVKHSDMGVNKSYWIDDGFTLAAQYKAVPDFAIKGSSGQVCKVLGSEWMLTVHPPAPSTAGGDGHVDCLLCSVELRVKRGFGIDTIRQHAASGSHINALYVFRLGAKQGMAMKSKHLAQDAVAPVLSLDIAPNVDFASNMDALLSPNAPSLRSTNSGSLSNKEEDSLQLQSTLLVEAQLQLLIDKMKDRVKNSTKSTAGGSLAEEPMTTAKTSMLLHACRGYMHAASNAALSALAFAGASSQEASRQEEEEGLNLLRQAPETLHEHEEIDELDDDLLMKRRSKEPEFSVKRPVRPLNFFDDPKQLIIPETWQHLPPRSTGEDI
ncbi:hypothetical protein CEUSTIGMA_g12296.t1 [Chlamydomonas eustigma]|uniref:Uncharacterized protein n=1 Tax=Chlamydomonas eustigma TaxID=1157962 RepID=A0A250XP68_9CHLO|nr:hypothetical protein CEUSTIGMA_g12296.t1 [Chlamydomonas eustigma]|eukprot:GAX84875.1 hypothetical protein CEUSTIGMA_g12296.t1 [Chlamydomonas eustigma]